MKKIIICMAMLACTISFAQAADVVIPAKINKEEVVGKIFDRPSIIITKHDGGTHLDAQTLLGKDRKFETGMYKAEAGRYEMDEPYGVDEFMYFLKGSVKLTSSDGSVQIINAGEAVTIPKEWTGIWETDGYTKFYAIYYPNGLPE